MGLWDRPNRVNNVWHLRIVLCRSLVAKPNGTFTLGRGSNADAASAVIVTNDNIAIIVPNSKFIAESGKRDNGSQAQRRGFTKFLRTQRHVVWSSAFRRYHVEPA
jgi:hypothetical protein